MKITLTLSGHVAEQVVRDLALRYARLCIKTSLPTDKPVSNPPWSNGWGHKGEAAERRQWEAKANAKRADYKRALQQLMNEVPAVAPLTLRVCTWLPPNVFDYYAYSGTLTEKAAAAYADLVFQRVFEPTPA